MSIIGQACTNFLQWLRSDSPIPNLGRESTSLLRTPLHAAVISGDYKLAKRILKQRGDLAVKQDAHGCTPLHLAAARNDVSIVQLLLQQDSTACAQLDNFERTPLHYAVIHNHLEVIDMLLESDPSVILIKTGIYKIPAGKVPAIEKVADTIFHIAIKNTTKLKTMRKLVDCLYSEQPSAELLNHKDQEEKTVLDIAASTKQFKILKYLLDHENLKFAPEAQREALSLVSEKEKHGLLFGYIDSTKKKKDNEWRIERVDTIMVVATLIFGIAFQAAINPPGGVWSDESKIDSAVEPVTFAYYIGKMFGHEITKDWQPYIQFHTDPQRNVTMRVEGRDTIHLSKNQTVEEIKGLIAELEKLVVKYSVNALGGLIVEEEGFREILARYSNGTGDDAIFPYIMRYSGFPILGYTYPMHYTVYMIANTVALLICVTTMLFVIGGFMNESSPFQIRLLVVLICVSIGCVTFGYLTIFLAMTPDYFRSNPVDISMAAYGGVWVVCGVTFLVWKAFRRVVRSKKKLQYKSGRSKSSSWISFWKLTVFLVGIGAFFLIFRLTIYPSFYRQLSI